MLVAVAVGGGDAGGDAGDSWLVARGSARARGHPSFRTVGALYYIMHGCMVGGGWWVDGGWMGAHGWLQCTHIHSYTLTYTHVCSCVLICAHMCSYVLIYTHIYSYTLMYTYVYLCVLICGAVRRI